MSDLARQLAEPSRLLSLEALAAAWVQARVAVRIAGYGHLAHDTVLLRQVRGGVGRVLMRSASDEAIAGMACPWRPPCGLDVLFREQGRSGPHGIPKPYVLAAHRRGNDLDVVLTLFGMAMDWMPVVSHALVTTLRRGIDWRALRPAVFAPRICVMGVTVSSSEGIAASSGGSRMALDFLTPLNAEGDDPLERPATVLARLARRVEGLARWQDAAVDEDWPVLGAGWAELDYDARALRRVGVGRRSGRGNRTYSMDAVAGILGVAGVPSSLRAMLELGQFTHVGKGASEGYGHFVLVEEPDFSAHEAAIRSEHTYPSRSAARIA